MKYIRESYEIRVKLVDKQLAVRPLSQSQFNSNELQFGSIKAINPTKLLNN